MIMSRRVHAVVDGEIAADQVRAHRGVFPRRRRRPAHVVGLIFPVVDPHCADVVLRRDLGYFVCWFGPVAAAAEAWMERC